jgi:hypothetical protein
MLSKYDVMTIPKPCAQACHQKTSTGGDRETESTSCQTKALHSVYYEFLGSYKSYPIELY